jgi:hypothetical protein
VEEKDSATLNANDGRSHESNKEELSFSALNYGVEDEKSHENYRERLSFSVIFHRKEDEKSSERNKLLFFAMNYGEEHQ